MAMEHSSHCVHCLNGCDHPHDDTTRRGLAVGIETTENLYGPVRHPDFGFVLGTDEWRRMRCRFCEEVVQTPLEMIPPMCSQDVDGAYFGTCGLCQHDIIAGRTPGFLRRWGP